MVPSRCAVVFVIEGHLPEMQICPNCERNLEREAVDWSRYIQERARKSKAKRGYLSLHDIAILKPPSAGRELERP